MKLLPFAGAALSALMLLSPAAQAHKRWLLPSHTVVSDTQWITLDTSASNDIFFVDKAFPLDGVRVTGPDGKDGEIDNRLEGHRRSVFDVHLSQQGSYRISLFRPLYVALYEQDGERHHQRGDSPDALLEGVPEGATEVRISEVVSHLETFATVGAPTTKGLAPTGKGLELAPVTHPNDLYAGETARFRFLVDGQPVSGLEVEVMPAGTRYRDSQDAWTVTTNDQGEVSLQWPGPGRYYLEASHGDDRADHPKANGRRLQYMGTFEVLPL